MKRTIRKIRALLKRTGGYSLWQRLIQNKEYKQWLLEGKPLPPPHKTKQLTVSEYAKKYNLEIFVETGTYLGDMINAVVSTFDEIYSIELDSELFQLANIRFSGINKINLLQGDAGTVMQDVLKLINRPSLFWLDAHFSSGATAHGKLDTPIQQELIQIFNHPLSKQHVILIDDARHFNGKGDYPTIMSLQKSAGSAGFNQFSVEDDIIRISYN